MPRLISRLLKRLEDVPGSRKQSPEKPIRRKRIVSLHGPLVPPPSLSAVNRTQSILLDHVNPIINPDVYTRHKSLPPKVFHNTRQRVIADEVDQPRSMTNEELKWWSSPYLRMLSSPVRSCSVCHRYLPSDFLIRLAPMRLPTPTIARQAQSLVPDGLEHPKYNSRRFHIGYYIICWKHALHHLAARGYYKHIAPNLSIHSLLGSHISHLLRVRVLQELELLADRLQARPQGSEDTTLIRRLTRAEWKSIKSTGTIPYANAVAVVVVPPLNRNPVTKKRPDASVDMILTDQGISEEGPTSPRTLLPLSTIHPSAEPHSLTNLPDYLPSFEVPLYHGVSLFPMRSQRAALHARLTRLLLVERRARYREHGRQESLKPQDGEPGDRWVRGDQKASHAFLLCSDEKTARRADVAAVAIALWRIRMWEGAGWEEFGGGSNGWEVRK